MNTLYPKGFCGSFLVSKDSMASPACNKDEYWPDILVFEGEADVRATFSDYGICRITEHQISDIRYQISDIRDESSKRAAPVAHILSRCQKGLSDNCSVF